MKRHLHLMVILLSVLCWLFPAATVLSASWPAAGDWIPYTVDDGVIQDAGDYDGPAQLEIVSHGGSPSVFYQLTEGTLSFRMRVSANEAKVDGKGGFANGVWAVLVDIDGDGYREFALAIDGRSGKGQNPDDVLVVCSDTEDWSLDGVGVQLLETLSAQGSARVEAVDDGSGHSYVDWQVPTEALDGCGLTFEPQRPFGLAYLTSKKLSDVGSGDFATNDPTHDPYTDGVPFGDPISFDPTAVVLAYFDVLLRDGAHVVTWETAMEVDHLGFHLYRSPSPGGPFTRINGSLIPPQNPGASFGGLYEWVVEDVNPHATVHYRLEALDVHGGSAHYDLEVVGESEPTAVRLVSLDTRAPLRGVPPAGLLLLSAALGLKLRRR
jgi:hypothetical protein